MIYDLYMYVNELPNNLIFNLKIYCNDKTMKRNMATLQHHQRQPKHLLSTLSEYENENVLCVHVLVEIVALAGRTEYLICAKFVKRKPCHTCKSNKKNYFNFFVLDL